MKSVMEKIGFNIMQLFEEKVERGERFVLPKEVSFSSLESSFHLLIDNVYYDVKVEKNSKYIWFVFDYGKPNPIDTNLTNINTGKKKTNPRTIDEAELIQQLFVLYRFDKSLLYISNLKKEKTFVKMIMEKLDTKFHTQKFFKNREEFISLLKEVEEISFTDAKNLFNQDTKRRQALRDLTGTDAPEKFSLITKYKKENKVVEFIKRLFESRDNNQLDDLVIRGIDNDNFGFTYNIDSFIQKVIVQVNKNENGLFDSESVKNELLRKLDYEG